MEMPLAFANSLASTTELAMMNSSRPGYLLKFNPDGTLAGKLQVEEDNGDNALSADGTTGYVLCEGDHRSPGSYVQVDLASWNVARNAPLGIYPVEMDVMPRLGG
jgi:hypothetical protein